MSVERPFVSPEAARARIEADLDVIDAAVGRLGETSTDLVGNAFRVEVAERLEQLDRVVRGLSYRMFAELADPPDGDDGALEGPGVRLRDVLARRLRIVPAEVRRRFRVAARITARRSVTGAPVGAELPALAAAVAAGALGEDHIREVCRAIDVLPAAVADQKGRVEATLVRHARGQDAAFVAVIGRRIADVLNPDGLFDDADRAARRGLTLGRQGPDGMSRLSGWLTPEARAYLEAVGAAVRPGHHVPDSAAVVVDGASDTRTGGQRLHDALAWGLRAGIESATLGTHRGIAVTVIVSTTLAELDQAARACADASVPMPAPARHRRRIGAADARVDPDGRGWCHQLPGGVRRSPRAAALPRARHPDRHRRSAHRHVRPATRAAPARTAPWRATNAKCTTAPDWDPDGRFRRRKLFFGCGPDHKLVNRRPRQHHRHPRRPPRLDHR